jgi:myo-inositol 2-dehydrogenase/D-chiro-inositol 1-dehydrogenase
MSETASDRRDFLAAAAGTVAATAAFGTPDVHVSVDDSLKIGLVGCGGRGSGAAGFAMEADANAKLVALGDMFPERLESAKANLREKGKEKFAVDDKNCFVGWDAYKHVTDMVDVVLLATPPHFRPMHLKYAVEKGKHAFIEKPVAVDAPGVRSVLESAKKAKEKGLSICHGFCYRFHPGVRELMAKVHAGDIGDVVAIQSTYNTGYLWKVDRTPSMTDMEWQLRNWLYFTWLSGDHNVEQHVHSIDKAMWAMEMNANKGAKTHPLKCVGLGGRQTRVEPVWGNIFDHHAVVYEFEGGARVFSYCRQQAGAKGEDSDRIMGTRGQAFVQQFGTQRIDVPGKSLWRYRNRSNCYLVEHQEHLKSIRDKKPMDVAEKAAYSTLMAIMGRMATYTGQEITWEMALNSKQDLTPPKYDFGPLPVAEVAKPGVTKFV